MIGTYTIYTKNGEHSFDCCLGENEHELALEIGGGSRDYLCCLGENVRSISIPVGRRTVEADIDVHIFKNGPFISVGSGMTMAAAVATAKKVTASGGMGMVIHTNEPELVVTYMRRVLGAVTSGMEADVDVSGVTQTKAAHAASAAVWSCAAEIVPISGMGALTGGMRISAAMSAMLRRRRTLADLDASELSELDDSTLAELDYVSY